MQYYTINYIVFTWAYKQRSNCRGKGHCYMHCQLIVIYWWRSVWWEVWWEEILANLANHQQFTKLKLFKLVVTFIDLLGNLFINQPSFAKIFIRPLSPNIIIANISHYTVLYMIVYDHFLVTIAISKKAMPTLCWQLLLLLINFSISAVTSLYSTHEVEPTRPHQFPL